MPWVVPPAEVLLVLGELNLTCIGREVSTPWTRYITMGGPTAKPGYTAGLLYAAFTREEMESLKDHATPTRSFRVTQDLCFPFLICETKAGQNGLNEADRQNVQNASIAVRAIFELYQEAFGPTDPRVRKLYGKALVFTVSHDNDRVLL